MTEVVDRAYFKDKINVSKSYASSVLIEGKEVPIVHRFGKDNAKN